MEENKKYNAADFARYHSGTMPPNEMHAIEKAALEDPFLADALDGYAYSADTKKEIDEIKLRLNEKRKQKKEFSLLSFSQNTWWKIAAMVLLIAGGGYLFFFMNAKKENSLAVKQEVIKKEKDEMISHVNNDSTSAETNIAFEKPPAEKDKISSRQLPAPVYKSHESRAAGVVTQKELIQREMEISQDRSSVQKADAVAMNKTAIAPNVKIDDSANKTLFLSSDTDASMAAFPKDVSKEVSKDSANGLVMEDKKPSMEEVVVVGYGSTKRSKVTEELKGKVSGIQTDGKIPLPREGFENFNQYIKDSALVILDLTGQRVSANVLLSFRLNMKGRPMAIEVIESSCKACESEAVRLLKNGPAWKGSSGAKGNVRIQF
jgi:hypothetical protein